MTIKVDQVFATAPSGQWALAHDGLLAKPPAGGSARSLRQQWILQRRYAGGAWNNLSFVRSEKDILARCMREKGVDASDARYLLSGLPNTFDEWKSMSDAIPASVAAPE